MASRLGAGIDSPTLGQWFEVGQFHAVQSSAAARTAGLPAVTNAGADVESGAGGPVVATVRGGSDYPAAATVSHQTGHARLRSVRVPFLWG
ncbi:hypothetical protein [Flindersiella endophytica]